MHFNLNVNRYLTWKEYNGILLIHIILLIRELKVNIFKLVIIKLIKESLLLDFHLKKIKLILEYYANLHKGHKDTLIMIHLI